MKALLIIFALFAIQSQAQTPYIADLTFNIGDSTDSDIGIKFKRKATIEAMLYNTRTRTINVQVSVRFFKEQTEIKRLIKPYRSEFSVTDNVFVLASNGTIVGDRAKMRQLYGVIQTPATDTTEAIWRQSVFGGDSLTTPCMGQYTFLTRAFDQTNRLHNILKQLAQQAALEGKLND